MWKSLAHNDMHGPFSADYKNQKGVEAGFPMADSSNKPVGVTNGTAPVHSQTPSYAQPAVTEPYPST